MKEATLWEHLKPALKKLGKFQKICDRFTPGIPDILGCAKGVPYAIELKEFQGVHILKTKFRPGQVDWLNDWIGSGGIGLVIVSHGSQVMVFNPQDGELLETGMPPGLAKERSLINFLKSRDSSWAEFIKQLGDYHEQVQGAGQGKVKASQRNLQNPTRGATP